MTRAEPAVQYLADRPSTTAMHRALLALLFLGVVGARWIQLATFGTDVPYWDQWDGEIANLYLPFVDGSLSWSHFFAPHNEHRILFTRLINLALFAANDSQFDNLLAAHANAVLYGVMLALFSWPLLRRLSGASLLLGWGCVALVGVMPIAFDNLLFGFQSPFFIMNAFAVAAFAALALGSGATAIVIALTLAVASLFTMAPGLLTAPAVAFVALLRWRNGQLRGIETAVVVGVAGAITAFGLWLLPHVGPHDALRAQNLRDFAAAAVHVLSWPLPGGPLGVLVLWWPAAVMLWRVVARPDRERSGIDLYLLAVCAWGFLQAFAVAYSRGHDLMLVPPRYADTLGFAPLANLALAVRLFGSAGGTQRRWLTAAASVCAIGCACGFALATARSTPELFHFAEHFGKSRANLRAYLAGEGVNALAGKPDPETTYPNLPRLASLLDNPTIRTMLPSSIRPPLSAPAPGCTAFQSFGAYPTTPATPYAFGSFIAGVGNPSTGVCRSLPFQSRSAYLRFRMAGYPHERGLSLTVDGATRVDVTPPSDPRETWIGVTVRNPGGEVVWTASDGNPEFWFAFTMPVEVGRLSAWRQRLDARLDLAPP